MLVIITPKETSSSSSALPPFLLLLLHDSVEIPPKTRYKQKQNETHYENITHFIHLTLKNTILGLLHNISENNKLYM